MRVGVSEMQVAASLGRVSLAFPQLDVSSRRMTSRGRPLATALVLPMTSKPAFSNIARVPTKAIVRSIRSPWVSTG